MEPVLNICYKIVACVLPYNLCINYASGYFFFLFCISTDNEILA